MTPAERLVERVIREVRDPKDVRPQGAPVDLRAEEKRQVMRRTGASHQMVNRVLREMNTISNVTVHVNRQPGGTQ